MTYTVFGLEVTEAFIWSVALTVIGITGHYLSGAKSHWGWFIGMCAQALWVVFAVQTKQYGFILAACLYFSIYWKNWQAWRKDAKPKVEASAP
jgi:nicotinamide riboside transporter PnuC